MKPVSVNHYWKMRKGGGRYITELGSKFKQLVLYAVRAKRPILSAGVTYKLKIELHSDTWLTKKGMPSLNAGDCDNYGKVCCDALFEALGINDALIWELEIKKVYDQVKNKTRLILFEL